MRPRRSGPSDGSPLVFVADEQSECTFDVAKLAGLAEHVLVAEGVRGDCELNLIFVNEATMTELNSRFMGADGPTDVLAFPLDDDAVEGGRFPDAGTSGPDRPPHAPADVPLILGDVIVCPSVAVANAPDHTGTFDDEMELLVVHGVLHVLGMDHAEPDEATIMQRREKELLAAFIQARTSDGEGWK